MSKGEAFKAIDGRLDTDIKIKSKKKLGPWFAAKLPRSNQPHMIQVFNTAKGKRKQRQLAGFEIWQGKKEGKLEIKCGGPFHEVNGVGPFQAQCPGNKKKRYVTVVVPGKKRTLNIAEVKVFVRSR